MQEDERRKCRVQLLGVSNPDQAVGWGVLVSVTPPRIVTCTHLLQDTAFSDDMYGDGVQVVRVLFLGCDDMAVRLFRTTDISYPLEPQSRRHSDICVLELATPVAATGASAPTIPTDAAKAIADHNAIGGHEYIIGFGMSERHPGGHSIEGRRKEGKWGHRAYITGLPADLVIRPGSSGTPLFVEGRGLIGIVAGAQQTASGTYIPVGTLGQVVPELAKRADADEAARPVAPTRSALPDFHVLLEHNIDSLDRDAQWFAFKDQFDRTHRPNGNAFACLIAGAHKDLPHKCHERFERALDAYAASPRSALGSPPVLAGRRASYPGIKYEWPKERRFNVEATFQAQLRALNDELRDRDAPIDAAAVRDVLDAATRPLLCRAKIDPTRFHAPQAELLQRWLALLAEIGRKDTSQPLILSLVLTFPDDADTEAGIEQLLSGRATGWRALFVGRRRAVLSAEPALKTLPALDHVRLQDVLDWIDLVAGEAAEPSGVADAKYRFLDRLGAADRLRLSDALALALVKGSDRHA